MEIINLRNKFNLRGREIVSILGVLISFCGFSQANKHQNLPNYDNRFLHYGFSVGGNYSLYRLKNTEEEFFQQNSVESVRSVPSYSFSLGFILNMRLAEYFDLRLLPTVAFYERRLNYEGTTIPGFTRESSFIEAPLLIKYKSQRRGNYRMYMVGGIKPGFEVGGKESQDGKGIFETTGRDLSLELGLGLDIYYELFKFSPELRFSLGMLDLHKPIDSEYSRVIDRLNTYTVSLFFFFE